MNVWDTIQIALLLILLERVSIIRNRYKLALEYQKSEYRIEGHFAIWIYCKQKNAEKYSRNGGRRLLIIRFDEKK